MYKSPESLKLKIQEHVENPEWTQEHLTEVRSIVEKLAPHAVHIMSNAEEQEIERLRGALVNILNDFDITITQHHIVFQPKDNETWWYRNYPWVLGLITTILTGLGILVRIVFKV